MRDEICDNLLLTHTEYDELYKSAPHRYKRYTIPKKSKPQLKREICQPAKELKIIQKYIIENIINSFPVHDCAMAYQKNKSAYLNAHRHKDNTYIIKLDFLNFFNSITAHDFKEFLDKAGTINNEYIPYLLNFLFFYDYKKGSLYLSIGAPSSPFISNVLLYDFDEGINKFCLENNVIYTRYADDITLSSNHLEPLNKCYKYVLDNLKLGQIKNLKINDDKTKFLSKKYKRIITGFVISNTGNVSLGRNKKREIRGMVHSALNDKLNTYEDLNYLIGILGHIKSFDKEYWSSLEKTYGSKFWKSLQDKIEN